MRLNLILLVTFLTGLLLPGMTYALERPVADTIGLRVYFRQGYATPEYNYRENGVRMQAFVSALKTILEDPTRNLKTIHVVAGCSPEGSAAANRRLSAKRASNVAAYLRSSLTLPDSLLQVESLGVDWQGLIELVEISDMRHREEVLALLRNTPEWIVRDGRVVDGRMHRLGMLHGGRPYWYMYEHIYPELRHSGVSVVSIIERSSESRSGADSVSAYVQPATSVEIPVENILATSLVEDSVASATELPQPVSSLPAPKKLKSICFLGLKTNLLYDAALVPNIGIEFFCGRNWSVGADWMYSWWNKPRGDFFWRTYGGDVEIRRWFGRTAHEAPLTGHHIGFYGQMTTFDFALGRNGVLADRWSWGAGVSYGYSHPVGRRLNLDFTIGVGYFGGEYKKYRHIDDCYVWQSTHRLRWFGPTKAEISLVWLPWRGRNGQKGGAR